MRFKLCLAAAAAAALMLSAPVYAKPPTTGCRGNCDSGGNSTVTNTNTLNNTISNSASASSAAAASSTSSVNFHPTLSNTQGQLQGQRQGQSQNQSNSQTGTFSGNSAGNTTTTTFAPSTHIDAPAIAPDLSSLAPSSPCMGGVTASGGGVGVSIGFGYTWKDDQCENRENAKIAMQEAQEIASMGYREAAVAILCNVPQISTAMGESGKYCPLGLPYNPNAKTSSVAAPTPLASAVRKPGYVMVGRDANGTPHWVPSSWVR